MSIFDEFSTSSSRRRLFVLAVTAPYEGIEGKARGAEGGVVVGLCGEKQRMVGDAAEGVGGAGGQDRL